MGSLGNSSKDTTSHPAPAPTPGEGQQRLLRKLDHIPSDLVTFARTHSPFYRTSLSHLPPDAPFSSLPLTDTTAYWTAAAESPSNILTGAFNDGVVMRSGGSTGSPKYVYLTREELRRMCAIKAHVALTASGLVPGDRIANLGPMGGLYGSLMLNNTGIMELPIDMVQLPIGGFQPEDVMADAIEHFQATVILSTIYSVTKLAGWLEKQGKRLESVRLILFTGEQFFKDVRESWNRAYPNALIQPYVYGSVECGPVALPVRAPGPGQDDDDTDSNPVYRVLRPAAHMEIVDQAGMAITEPGVRGSVVVTHLLKRLQPLIRYPVGDIAAWEDYEDKTFRLYGRDNVAIKVSNAMLDRVVLETLVRECISPDGVGRFQAVVRRTGGRNVLVLRVAVPKPDNAAGISNEIDAHLRRVSHMWMRNRDAGVIAPPELEFVEYGDLVLTPGSNKIKTFIEERF